ncbi:MAG: hypothetical protein Q8L71_02505 [Thiobacillus sp.]|nr:hypothetical protein [Thiobacillus sp.]
MPRKPPLNERRLILARDQRRKYGSRLTFQVQRSVYIGDLENVTLLLPEGTLATIQPGQLLESEGGKRYEMEIVGFPTASEAESAGMQMAQALLLCAISLDFGLRLSYHSHEPPAVFDRTVSTGAFMSAEAYSSWPQQIVLNEFEKALAAPLRDRRLLLSMELFAAAALESNDRARFVMAVSALEPLAEQQPMEPEVSNAVDALCIQLDADASVPENLRQSVRGRLLQLKSESVRQALKRLCGRWFPSDPNAWTHIDRAYALRSELLHEGRPHDLDILLHEETRSIANYLRRIYQQEYGYALQRAPTV